MVELYTITVWSFSAFYNTRKVGARGCHRAAPVSRYQSSAWSSKSGRGVVRLAYRGAMYAAFNRERFEKKRNWNPVEIKAAACESSFDAYDENRYKIVRTVSTNLSARVVELKRDAKSVSVPEFKAREVFASETKAPVFFVSAHRFSVFVKTGIRVVQKYSEEKSSFEKPVVSKIVPAVAKTNFARVEFVPEALIVPVRKFAISKERKIRREKIISLLRNVKMKKPIQTSSLPGRKKEIFVQRKVLSALNLRKDEKISPEKGGKILRINMAKCRVKNKVNSKKVEPPKNKFTLPNMRELRLPTNPVPEYVVKKIVRKFEKLKKKEFDALKILDYSISYAKEKQIALVKRSFNLWRILWARINGKWAMVVIDDVTKVVVGWGMFAKMRGEQAIRVINDAMKNYGTPQAVVNYEQVLFCSGDYCEKNPGESIEKYLKRKGIEYLISIVDEGVAFARGCEFLEHVRKKMENGSSNLLAFVNMYNLKGIKGVGNAVPAFHYLQSG